MPEPNTGCWLWEGSIATGKAGYRKPMMRHKGKYLAAARESWKAANGNQPIDETQFVLHRCNVSECVNPAHLYLGTAKDNASDGVKNGKWGRMISAEKIMEIRIRSSANESAPSIASSFGIHFNTVRRHRKVR